MHLIRFRACALPAVCVAQLMAAHAADKSQYTLLNPTPTEAMRDMVSDQAMFTLTPFTIDAGHFQLETDAVDYFHDRDRSAGANVLTTGWAFGRGTVKAGLCNRADLEVSFTAYSEYTTDDRIAGTKTTVRGFSNLTLSSKVSVWGNEGGTTTALAILPFVSFPTTQLTPGYEDYTGGVEIPFQIKAPCGARLGLMTGFELAPNGRNDITASFINGISVRGPLANKVDAYAEFFTTVDQDSGTWNGLVNAGLAYQLAKNIEIHGGATFGVHNYTDYNPYIGFSWRY